MLEKEVTDIVKTILEDYESLFLVEVSVKGTPGTQKVLVLVDGEPSVDIDQCAEISRKVGAVMEDRELFSTKYQLEVSSPGIDLPLRLPRQYRKNIGRQVKIELLNGKRLKGKLETAGDDQISVLDDKTQEVLNLRIDDIKKTNILVSFN